MILSSGSLAIMDANAAFSKVVLDSELKRLDRYPAIILDDLGHVQQDRQEMEGLRDCLNRAYC